MAETPENPNSYQGKQVIINSDRLLFNAKTDSILLYSNEAIGFSTQGSIHFDTSILDESKVIINSPNIYLGLDGDKIPTEPAVLGNELADYLAGDLGILDVIEDFIDVVTDNITFTDSKGGSTGPNTANDTTVAGLKKMVEDLRTRAKLPDYPYVALGDFKSEITKLS